MRAAKTFNPEDQTFSPPPFYLDQMFGAGKWEAADDDIEIEMDGPDDEAENSSGMEDEDEDERENRAELKRTRSEI